MQHISSKSEITPNRDRVATGMEEPAAEPYLGATLQAPQRELDLTGATPFCLRITATLHVQSPVLFYVADTLLWPQNALRTGGINFAS